MIDSLGRIYGMFMRYFYLHKRSIPRTLEIIFWPVMELLVWGFVTVYIRDISAGGLAKGIVFLINGMIFWDILYRGQQAVSISFMEEIWTQNMMNVLVTPLRITEWVFATFLYGLLKTFIITGVLSGLAFALYRFNIVDSMGFALVPFAFNLLIFGWSLGIFTSGLVIRWGYAVEALIWGVPFLIQPFSAIFYPLSVLPPPAQAFAKLLPSTYLFEGMRGLIQHGTLPHGAFLTALGLNVVYLILGIGFFQWMFRRARDLGRLVRLGLD